MTSDKILTAARELFEEKGFDLTSVREIAAKAGVNVALINYHYKSKENLLLSIMEQSVDSSRMKLNSINSLDIPATEKLEQVIEMYTEKIFANCKYHQLIHRELSTSERPELVDGINKILSRNSQELRNLLDEGKRKKVFRKDADIDMVIATLFGVMYQTTHAVFRKRWTTPEETEEDFKERVKKYLNEALLSYLIK
jgi:AcrR family transcriptional regulator